MHLDNSQSYLSTSYLSSPTQTKILTWPSGIINSSSTAKEISKSPFDQPKPPFYHVSYSVLTALSSCLSLSLVTWTSAATQTTFLACPHRFSTMPGNTTMNCDASALCTLPLKKEAVEVLLTNVGSCGRRKKMWSLTQDSSLRRNASCRQSNKGKTVS